MQVGGHEIATLEPPQSERSLSLNDDVVAGMGNSRTELEVDSDKKNQAEEGDQGAPSEAERTAQVHLAGATDMDLDDELDAFIQSRGRSTNKTGWQSVSIFLLGCVEHDSVSYCLRETRFLLSHIYSNTHTGP